MKRHQANSRGTEQETTQKNENPSLDRALARVGTGLCFVVFPVVWALAFAAHPDLLAPRFPLGAEELVRRARGNAPLQSAHALVALVNCPAAVPIALHFRGALGPTAHAAAGLAGAALAVVGACLLAADKGALCLAVSALDTLPPDEFEAMMPGLVAIFSFKGWMFLVWGLVLLPVGVIVQLAAMIKADVLLPQWQLRIMLISVVFIGFPDGAEIVNLGSALLMAVAMVPYGIHLIKGEDARQVKAE